MERLREIYIEIERVTKEILTPQGTHSSHPVHTETEVDTDQLTEAPPEPPEDDKEDQLLSSPVGWVWTRVEEREREREGEREVHCRS